MIKVILDTNVLVRADFSFGGPDMTILKQAIHSGTCELVVPKVVLEEIINKYRERLEEKQRSALASLRSLNRLLQPDKHIEMPALELGALVKNYRTKMQAELQKLGASQPAYDHISHEHVIARDLNRRKPFKETGAGYRDALLWETILEKVIDERAVSFFVTENKKDFCAEESDDVLHPHLLEDLDSRGLSDKAIQVFPTLKRLIEVLPHQDARAALGPTIHQRAISQFRSFFAEQKDVVADALTIELKNMRVPGWPEELLRDARLVNLDPTHVEVEQSIDLEKGIHTILQYMVVGEGEFHLTIDKSLYPLISEHDALNTEEEPGLGDGVIAASMRTQIPFRLKLEVSRLSAADPARIVDFQIYVSDTLFTMRHLLEGVSDEASSRTADEQARWLLAHLLEWHLREDAAAWWEYFRLRDLPLDDYFDERSALAALKFLDTIDGTAKRPIHRYTFPAQDHDIRRGDEVCVPDGNGIGTVEDLDLGARTIDLQHAGKWADERPTHVFVRRNVPSTPKPAALLALGRWVTGHGIDAPGSYRAARDLILRRPPRLIPGSHGLEIRAAVSRTADEVATACRLGRELDHGVLAIQGPPGTGKTYTGAHMIVDLIRTGKKVGVTASSHEVIRNLLRACIEVAREQGLENFKCLHKGKPKESSPEALHAFNDNKRIHALFDSGEYSLLGGTSWLWARPDFAESVDVLFMDEAGQLSLADALAVAGSARSLVLLGDPQQLEQPHQAKHPPGTGVSAFAHILGGRKTIPDALGLFLQQTRRLHPDICAFTAEVFYDDRLSAVAGLARQAIVGAARFPEAGLVYVPVAHEGRRSRSKEEVEVIETIVAELTGGTAQWRDHEGVERPLEKEDLMIVAPYNEQVTALATALPGVRVGTVDKFQGQQAPVVIVSLTTSSPNEAPRGRSFLYSANRLNVATSRAKGLCILVGNPKLFEVDCKMPEQMRLAGAFCRYVEMATTVE